MLSFLSKEVRDGLELARKAKERRKSKLRVQVGDAVFPVLRFWHDGFVLDGALTPHLRGLQDWKHLSGASSLCGACTEACPVKIDLHHHLLQHRRTARAEKPVWWEKLRGSVQRFDNLNVLHIDGATSAALAATAARGMELQVSIQDGTIWFSAGDSPIEVRVQRWR